MAEYQAQHSRFEHYKPTKSNNSNRVFHPIKAEYIFLSNKHGTFFKTEHILSHKTLENFKRIDVTQSIFSDYDEMKLEMNTKKCCQQSGNRDF